MFEFIAQSQSLPIPELVTGLTSAGGTALAMYKWNRREVERADKAQERADQVADEAIKVLTEVNLYLSQVGNHFESTNTKVATEHQTTRTHVTNALESLEKR